MGLFELLLATDHTWAKLPSTSTEITNFSGMRPEILQGLTLNEASAAPGFLAFAGIYLALAYMTFGYRWQDE